FYYKATLYGGGQLFLTKMVAGGYAVTRLREDLDVLNDFEGKVVADDGPQSVKFIHLAMTHSPYLLDRTCRVAERAPPDGPE
ncbi:hypothetical protein, partial [Acinetobacter baumannii]|uniref:hypothetical protein n=1 Tax=Acinetobacter baumannii TaxID=470 RepID=UPI001C098620